MGTPLGPKYILYSYMEPLGYSHGLGVGIVLALVRFLYTARLAAGQDLLT